MEKLRAAEAGVDPGVLGTLGTALALCGQPAGVVGVFPASHESARGVRSASRGVGPVDAGGWGAVALGGGMDWIQNQAFAGLGGSRRCW